MLQRKPGSREESALKNSLKKIWPGSDSIRTDGAPAPVRWDLSRSAQFFHGPRAEMTGVLGPHLGDDAIDLVLRLGKCLSRLPGELIGRADGRSEHRGNRPSEPRHIFRRCYGGNAESETGQKRRFEKCGSCRDGDN